MQFKECWHQIVFHTVKIWTIPQAGLSELPLNYDPEL